MLAGKLDAADLAINLNLVRLVLEVGVGRAWVQVDNHHVLKVHLSIQQGFVFLELDDRRLLAASGGEDVLFLLQLPQSVLSQLFLLFLPLFLQEDAPQVSYAVIFIKVERIES